jgi:hypothetical protein
VLARGAATAGGAALTGLGALAGLGGLAGCSDQAPPPAPSAAPEPPEWAVARRLMADKEHLIDLYSALIAKGGGKLTPFRDRHQAHLDELRRRFPRVTPTPSPPASPPGSASAVPGSGSPQPDSSGAPRSAAPAPVVSLSRLRELERGAAALRTRQLATVSPSFAQLLASIGACEAAHATALPRSL